MPYDKEMARADACARATRALVETVHTTLWLFLCLGVFVVRGKALYVLLGMILMIPLGWWIYRDCPMTVLENWVCPLEANERILFGSRNRLGTQIRLRLGLSVLEWDCVLMSLTYVLLFSCYLRILCQEAW